MVLIYFIKVGMYNFSLNIFPEGLFYNPLDNFQEEVLLVKKENEIIGTSMFKTQTNKQKSI